MKAKTKTTAICILCAALMATLLLAGCGAQTAEPQSIEAAESTPEPTPTPEPSPTPTPEPELPAGVSVTVDGTALSGSVVSGDVTYVSTEEFFAALGIDYTESDGMIELTWRGGELSLGGEGTELLSYRGVGYLPVMAVCEQMGISLLDDVEQNHLYCTPAAGDWVVPEGYRVPVFMYHYVAEDVPYDSQRVLSVRPSEMEEQLKYIVDNGYQPIWFEDLEHVDEYEKPIILTFDDGRLDNYTILYPLLQKYNVKATFFIITDSMNYNGGVSCMTPEQVKEVSDSGLVSIQSHTTTHPALAYMNTEQQAEQMYRSKLDLTRVTGKEPYVFCYPAGGYNGYTQAIIGDYYRFGICMDGKVYVTGADPYKIYRIYVPRGKALDAFAKMLEWQ